MRQENIIVDFTTSRGLNTPLLPLPFITPQKRPVKRRVSFLLRLMIVPIHQVESSKGSWIGTLASRNPVSNRWARRGTIRRHEPSGLQALRTLMMSPRRMTSSFLDPSPLMGEDRSKEEEEEEMSSGSNGLPAVDVVEALLFSSSHVPNSSSLPSTATTVKVEPRLPFRWRRLAEAMIKCGLFSKIPKLE